MLYARVCKFQGYMNSGFYRPAPWIVTPFPLVKKPIDVYLRFTNLKLCLFVLFHDFSFYNFWSLNITVDKMWV